MALAWELDKQKVLQWLEILRGEYEVIAPVRIQGEVVFNSLSATNHIALDYENTLMPPKEFFLPPSETMFSFTIGKSGFDIVFPEKKQEERVIFGMRPCDVHALFILDNVLGGDQRDEYYLLQRERSTLVALNCSRPAARCFCGLTGAGPTLSGGFDVLLTELDAFYFVEVGSEMGMELVDKGSGLFRKASEQSQRKKEQVVEQAKNLFTRPADPGEVTRKMEACFNDGRWAQLGERCMECGGCTYLCPTCYCFDVVDRVHNKEGSRLRCWDCCLLPGFTRMAGGINPRDSKEARIKQRFYHKWDYFVERFSILQCVGCGRCTETALCHIDWEQVFRSVVGER
ncbi:MAG: 4Fe-4S dicluster domain-containing protein [Chloroflexi bacterium]|nr:4Fe-4S dicluster domain-containing protein [Chloroflexota bacterium]MCL5076097.1 4Fe-4S dicluster domain-containing protein [Chloroflexota bacterium]